MFLLFLKNNWEAIVIALLVGIVSISFTVVKHQRDNARAELAVWKDVSAAQVIVEKQKLADAIASQKVTEAASAKQVSDLQINRDKLAKSLGKYYATKPVVDSGVRNASTSVLPPATSSNSTPTATSGQEPTSSGEIGGTACTGLEAENQVLTDALALETIDFNSARSRVDQDCLQVGCLTE